MGRTTVDTLYDTDFVEWTARTVELIRQGRLDEVDFEHVAEEIEDLGRRDRWETRNRLRVLIMHLLEWRIQPERREGSTWRSTINTQRAEIESVMKDSPSLRRYARLDLEWAYGKAVSAALDETGKDPGSVPTECPWTIEQILDDDYLPDTKST